MQDVSPRPQYVYWRPSIRIVPLDITVLAVATTRIEGTWKAHIRAVPGRSHDREYQEVLDFGTKLDPAVARVLFPDFKDIPYAY